LFTILIRKFVSTPDGGQIAVDWTPPFSKKPFDDTPTIVVLHGLTGGIIYHNNNFFLITIII
jgi:predicted alpha/beta-fold hydrolase